MLSEDPSCFCSLKTSLKGKRKGIMFGSMHIVSHILGLRDIQRFFFFSLQKTTRTKGKKIYSSEILHQEINWKPELRI